MTTVEGSARRNGGGVILQFILFLKIFKFFKIFKLLTFWLVTKPFVFNNTPPSLQVGVSLYFVYLYNL